VCFKHATGWLCRYVDAALYLTELQADGVLGAVGVTNFDVPRLEAMINKGAKLVSNQVSLHELVVTSRVARP
jgi:diketogulonate reductase-like aldo/keto reductase